MGSLCCLDRSESNYDTENGTRKRSWSGVFVNEAFSAGKHCCATNVFAIINPH